MKQLVWLAAALVIASCHAQPSLGGTDAGSSSASPDAGVSDAGMPDAGTSDAPPMFGDPAAGLQAMPGNCSSDGWCWLTPTPNGNDYTHIFGTGPDNIWLTGWATLLQWNGTTWIQHHPPVVAGESPGELAWTITGTSATDMWLLYETSLEHWDGTAWTIVETLSLGGAPGYRNFWDDPNGDLWVTYSTGDIKRWHGTTATVVPSCGCSLGGSIWGTSATDVFATTLPSGVMHFDGTSWTQIYSGGAILSGFQGKPGDVWLSSPNPPTLAHWDGTTLTTIPATAIPSGAWLVPTGYAASNDVWWWAGNPGNGFVHWDGSSVTFRLAMAADDASAITSGARIADRYWLVGRDGEIATMDQPYTIHRVIDGAYRWNEFSGIWGTADDNMYFTVGNELRHWTGTGYTVIPLDNGPDGETRELGALAGVHANGVDELFVSGYAVDAAHNATWSIFHFDGTTWTKTVTGVGLFLQQGYDEALAFDVMGPGEAMAVGANGFASYFTGGQWTPIKTGTTQMITSIYAPDHDHLWASGFGGTLLGWDRANPTVMTQAPEVPTGHGGYGDSDYDIRPITGYGGTTYAVQTFPFPDTVWTNAGSGWVQSQGDIPTGYGDGFLVVDATHAWASSSSDSHVYSWDGKGFLFPDDWNFHDIGSTRPMPHLFQPPGGKLWAGGESGIVQHP